ncbi:unnamed protein product [Schistosoma curassoni]|uniref:Uncharacterized protein n=1 Tax=Schistosoma curassoni TaxID=6186 RepID=A0A183K749_9TREM|nr:unnamed protein product [Schistosoma curassoni]
MGTFLILVILCSVQNEYLPSFVPSLIKNKAQSNRAVLLNWIKIL